MCSRELVLIKNTIKDIGSKRCPNIMGSLISEGRDTYRNEQNHVDLGRLEYNKSEIIN